LKFGESGDARPGTLAFRRVIDTVWRRRFRRAGLLAGGALALGPAFSRDARASVAGAATPTAGGDSAEVRRPLTVA
jgi:hypothetical protein